MIDSQPISRMVNMTFGLCFMIAEFFTLYPKFACRKEKLARPM